MNRSRNDRGTSVVEVTVVLLMVSIVTMAVLQVNDSLTRNTARQESLVAVQERARLAVAQFGRDVRAADGFLSGPDGTAGSRVEVQPGDGGSPAVPAGTVRWELQGDQLVRAVIDQPGGTVRSSRVVVDGVTPAPAGGPVFRYYDNDGNEITPSRPTGDVARCTVRVGVTLVVSAGGVAFTEQNEFQLRNRAPGTASC